MNLNKYLDVNDDDWNDNNETENSMPLGGRYSNTLIMNPSSTKNKTVRRRQTIDTAQGRQYASRRQHQTPLKQLQAILWPTRQTHNANRLNEHEQMPKINKKQTTTVQRSSSVRESNQNIINENLNEQKGRHRT